MQPKVTILARVKESDGKYSFMPVEYIKKTGKHRVPQGATSFYLRYTEHGRRKTEPVGREFEVALVEFDRRKTNLDRSLNGLAPIVELAAPPKGKSTSLTAAIADYVQTSESIGNTDDTVAAKARILDSFRDVAAAHGVSTVEQLAVPEVGRRIVLAYLVWMKKNLSTLAVDGTRRENTFYTRMRKLGAFLKQHGIKIKKDMHAAPTDTGLLAHNEFPKYKAKNAKMYSDEMIEAWKKAATVDELDVIETFLATGFRDEEVAHLEWSDIDFVGRTVNVRAKKQTAKRPWSWTPKDGESRPEDIPLSDAFVARMEDRRKRMAAQNCELIFPTGVCKPDQHLLRPLRRAAKRAGITERISLHTIRKTVGSNIAEKYGITYAMSVLGHSKLSTTQGYMAPNVKAAQKMREDLNQK